MSRAVSGVGELLAERGGVPLPRLDGGGRGWDASHLPAALRGDVSELFFPQCGP